jgi:hypothetical protein
MTKGVKEMRSRVYITPPEMLPALQKYNNFLEGTAPAFEKKLFFLLAVCDHDNLRRIAEAFPPLVFAYCCYTWRIDPRAIFTRDPRFMSARRVPQQSFITAKELPLFTDEILNSEYGGMINDKLSLYSK